MKTMDRSAIVVVLACCFCPYWGCARLTEVRRLAAADVHRLNASRPPTAPPAVMFRGD